MANGNENPVTETVDLSLSATVDILTKKGTLRNNVQVSLNELMQKKGLGELALIYVVDREGNALALSPGPTPPLSDKTPPLKNGESFKEFTPHSIAYLTIEKNPYCCIRWCDRRGCHTYCWCIF